MTTHLLTSPPAVIAASFIQADMQKLLVAENLFRRLGPAVCVCVCVPHSPQTTRSTHYKVAVTAQPSCRLFRSGDRSFCAVRRGDAARRLRSGSSVLRVQSCSVSLFELFASSPLDGTGLTCGRWQGSVRVYSTIDPVSVQMNGSLGVKRGCLHDLKPFQVSEGKTDHSLCHVGIPNPGQLLHWLKAARCTLRMFSTVRAKFKENQP